MESVGSRSGIIRNAATRSKAPAGDPSTIMAALQHVADGLGVRIERLRLADYDTVAQADDDLPSTGEVLATFPAGWKAAREAAGRQTRATAG